MFFFVGISSAVVVSLSLIWINQHSITISSHLLNTKWCSFNHGYYLVKTLHMDQTIGYIRNYYSSLWFTQTVWFSLDKHVFLFLYTKYASSRLYSDACFLLEKYCSLIRDRMIWLLNTIITHDTWSYSFDNWNVFEHECEFTSAMQIRKKHSFMIFSSFCNVHVVHSSCMCNCWNMFWQKCPIRTMTLTEWLDFLEKIDRNRIRTLPNSEKMRLKGQYGATPSMLLFLKQSMQHYVRGCFHQSLTQANLWTSYKHERNWTFKILSRDDSTNSSFWRNTKEAGWTIVNQRISFDLTRERCCHLCSSRISIG